MEEDLRDQLLAYAPLAAIVGDRIAWGERDGLPAIVLHKIAPGLHYTMTGPMGLTGPLLQGDCWAATPTERKALREAFVGALHQLTAPFAGAFITAEREGREPGEGPRPDGTTDFFRASLDFRAWHRPAA